MQTSLLHSILPRQANLFILSYGGAGPPFPSMRIAYIAMVGVICIRRHDLLIGNTAPGAQFVLLCCSSLSPPC